MDDKNPFILNRIIQEVDFILNSTNNMLEDSFMLDSYAQHALAMALLNIGELAKKLDTSYKTKYPDIPWEQIIGFRNAAAHGYDGLDMEIVWRTIQEDLPTLKIKFKNLS